MQDVILVPQFHQLELLLNQSASKSVVIVGGGASATLLLAELSTQLNNSSKIPTNIYIIDDSQAFKVGLAYSVDHPSFILNVAANRMGAWHEKPDDFFEWLTKYPYLWRNLHPDFLHINFHANDFAPRMIYGEYLRWVFDNAVATCAEKHIRVYKVTARAKSISAAKNSSGLVIELSSKESLQADAVILATGNSEPKHRSFAGENIFSSPYQPEFLQQDWRKLNNIIVVGSGLSMVDAIQHLSHQNFKGNIQVFSRHGLIPLPHLESSHQDCKPFKFSGLKSARKILNAVRKQIGINTEQNIFWQTTINSLRQETNDAWLALPLREQKKLRRILPWWNIVRHRIPTSAYDLLIKLQNEGRLTITKGEVKQVEHHGEYFLINLTHTTALIKAEKMVICSGYCYNQQLEKLCGNLVNPEAFHKSNDLKLSDQHELYALGPPLGNLLFETTAINEIRQQSLKIAAAISEQMRAQELFSNVETYN